MRTVSIVFVLLFVGGAVGATIWFSLFRDVHDYGHQSSQENRAAQVTGAAPRPVEPIKITVKPHDCTHVKSATIDGKRLTLYVQNDCHVDLTYIEYHWQSLAPDGTAIHAGYENTAGCPLPPIRKQAECVLRVEDDDRTASVEVWSDAH